jgi:hypothetical protein
MCDAHAHSRRETETYLKVAGEDAHGARLIRIGEELALRHSEFLLDLAGRLELEVEVPLEHRYLRQLFNTLPTRVSLTRKHGAPTVQTKERCWCGVALV